MTLGALAREEFRGAHWRKEHQARDDEGWLKHTLVSWNGGRPELWFRPVLLEGAEKTYEPKIRSY
jgi:succinate dehydrogenase subunit A (EC 1.3.5.1)